MGSLGLGCPTQGEGFHLGHPRVPGRPEQSRSENSESVEKHQASRSHSRHFLRHRGAPESGSGRAAKDIDHRRHAAPVNLEPVHQAQPAPCRYCRSVSIRFERRRACGYAGQTGADPWHWHEHSVACVLIFEECPGKSLYATYPPFFRQLLSATPADGEGRSRITELRSVADVPARSHSAEWRAWESSKSSGTTGPGFVLSMSVECRLKVASERTLLAECCASACLSAEPARRTSNAGRRPQHGASHGPARNQKFCIIGWQISRYE